MLNHLASFSNISSTLRITSSYHTEKPVDKMIPAAAHIFFYHTTDLRRYPLQVLTIRSWERPHPGGEGTVGRACDAVPTQLSIGWTAASVALHKSSCVAML